MSNTYTPNTKMAMPAIGDTGWAVPVNGNCALLDALSSVGGLAVTTTEVPSASLNVAVASGTYIKQDGTIAAFAGASPQAIAASSTQVLYLDLTNSGALTVAAAYPSTPHVRLATVATGSSTISSITDNRQCFNVVGAWADGVNITLGTGAGTQLGTSPSQKLGFFGKTPSTQPTMGAATAGAAYTGNEQAMLQAVYNAVRALGLGS
jgi:D-serine deaminase-like pyridoxal phosphate-dependent protein